MAYKALAGLNRTDGGRGAADDGEADGEGAENGDADGEGADGEKKPKRRARKVAEGDALTAHLEPNDAALNVKKLEMAFAVDPLFHRTSAKFDEGGAKGLLLHNLPVRHGTELDFDSAKPPRDPDAAPPAPAALPVGWLASVLPAASADGHVCTAFSTMWAAKERPVGWTSPDVPRPADERAAEEAAAAEEAEARRRRRRRPPRTTRRSSRWAATTTRWWTRASTSTTTTTTPRFRRARRRSSGSRPPARSRGSR